MNERSARLPGILGLRQAKRDGDVDFLLASLVDPEQRGSAARYLGELGVEEAVERIASLLHAADWKARCDAAYALGLLGAFEYKQQILEMARSDPDAATRSWSAGAFVRLANRTDIPVVQAMLDDPAWIVRFGVAQDLVYLGDPSSLELLAEAARREDTWWHRYLLRREHKRLRTGQMPYTRYQEFPGKKGTGW